MIRGETPPCSLRAAMCAAVVVAEVARGRAERSIVRNCIAKVGRGTKEVEHEELGWD